MRRVFLHAPNVHVGGGLTLLKSLLALEHVQADFEQLDIRAAALLPAAKGIRRFVRPTVFSRLHAELYLRQHVTKEDVVICFHGLMPLFSLKGTIVLFLQNRIIVSQGSLREYRFKTRVRLTIERLLLRRAAYRAQRIVVQTLSMAMQVAETLGVSTDRITVCPFVGNMGHWSTVTEKKYDFLYVASADAHKNHLRLLEAWSQLSKEGIRPHLVLTVDKGSDVALAISRYRSQYDLNITNVGVVSSEAVAQLYAESKALVYPSITESLGLPLLEAQEFGLPIVAGELDYIRDVVVPVETFNPLSALSISRAIKRHLGKLNNLQPISSAADFWKVISE